MGFLGTRCMREEWRVKGSCFGLGGPIVYVDKSTLNGRPNTNNLINYQWEGQLEYSTVRQSFKYGMNQFVFWGAILKNYSRNLCVSVYMWVYLLSLSPYRTSLPSSSCLGQWKYIFCCQLCKDLPKWETQYIREAVGLFKRTYQKMY